jgi:hypothetical protein
VDASQSGQVLVRRWFIVILGLAVTGCVMAWTWNTTVRLYESQAQVLMLPPSVPMQSADSSVQSSNPYLQLDYSLSVTADVVVRILATEPVKAGIMQCGGGQTVTVTRATPEVGGAIPPVAVITASDPTPDIARATAVCGVDELLVTLQRMQTQTGASESLAITAEVIEPPTTPVPVDGSRIRALVAIGIVGAALSLLLAFAIGRRRDVGYDVQDY